MLHPALVPGCPPGGHRMGHHAALVSTRLFVPETGGWRWVTPMVLS